MSAIIECPRCESDNVTPFLNNDAIWHCNGCGEMWESEESIAYIEVKPAIHPEPMEGFSL